MIIIIVIIITMISWKRLGRRWRRRLQRRRALSGSTLRMFISGLNDRTDLLMNYNSDNNLDDIYDSHLGKGSKKIQKKTNKC